MTREELKNKKRETMKQHMKHTVGVATGIVSSCAGISAVQVAIDATLTKNPIANAAIGTAGAVITIGGACMYVDQKAKAHLDYKEIMSIEEMARALSDK